MPYGGIPDQSDCKLCKQKCEPRRLLARKHILSPKTWKEFVLKLEALTLNVVLFNKSNHGVSIFRLVKEMEIEVKKVKKAKIELILNQCYLQLSL